MTKFLCVVLSIVIGIVLTAACFGIIVGGEWIVASFFSWLSHRDIDWTLAIFFFIFICVSIGMVAFFSCAVYASLGVKSDE